MSNVQPDLQPIHLPPPGTPTHDDLPHVLLVVDQLARTLGGGERIVLRLAQLLPRYGFRVSILTFLADPASPALTLPAPCPIYLLPLQRTYDLQALRAALALRRFLDRQRVRVVQTFFESSDLWAGLVVKTLSDAALIWSRRDMGILRGPKHHLAYRLLSSLPDRVFTVSELVREHAIQVDRIPPDRVETIYNGLDLPDLLPTERLASAHVITVGNIRPVKGHDVLLRAAALVLEHLPHATFSIAGDILDPVYFAELQTLARDLGITSAVTFLGSVPDPIPHLRTADLFVLPSRSEGFSNAIIEAMAVALPVVATTVGGNAEAVHDGSTGLLVPSDDPTALAHAMLALLTDPVTASRMGAAGRAAVLARFTTDAMLSRTTAAYRSLLD
jgi:glycosyltransferase involved in cell wall biosynthesis